MTAASAAVYDADIHNPDSLALLPLDESPWLPLYLEVLRWLPRSAHITDLGCGTGRLARLLANHGFEHYAGYDFSPAAIAEASSYVEDEGFTFHVADLEQLPLIAESSRVVYVCLEVLEHLNDDRSLIQRIPNGHTLLFSVPSYESATHVRVFRHISDVFRRYERLLDITAWRALDFGPVGRRIHLIEARRRADSWA